jgi:hypothetical protein
MNDTDTTPVSQHERCQYTNKRCPHRRAVKRNGQLHLLCEEHRENANRNQHRWLKNRAKRVMTTTDAMAASSLNVVEEVSIYDSAIAAKGKSADDVIEDKLLLDRDELNEFLDELTVSPEELVVLRAELAKAFSSQE